MSSSDVAFLAKSEYPPPEKAFHRHLGHCSRQALPGRNAGRFQAAFHAVRDLVGAAGPFRRVGRAARGRKAEENEQHCHRDEGVWHLMMVPSWRLRVSDKNLASSHHPMSSSLARNSIVVTEPRIPPFDVDARGRGDNLPQARRCRP